MPPAFAGGFFSVSNLENHFGQVAESFDKFRKWRKIGKNDAGKWNN